MNLSREATQKFIRQMSSKSNSSSLKFLHRADMDTRVLKVSMAFFTLSFTISEICRSKVLLGFLKTVCSTYDKFGELKKSLCHNSTGHYELIGMTQYVYSDPKWHFDRMCENDKAFYQGCGYTTAPFTSLKNAICQVKISVLHANKAIGEIVTISSLIQEPYFLPQNLLPH